MNLYNYINNNEFKYEIFVSNNKEIPFQMITFINRENRLICRIMTWNNVIMNQ